MNDMMYEFVTNFKKKLCTELNGVVKYEAYDKIDTVVFKVFFKGFTYSYPIDGVTNKIYSGIDTDELVEDFMKNYLRSVKWSIFKSDEQKQREEAKTGGFSHGGYTKRYLPRQRSNNNYLSSSL